MQTTKGIATLLCAVAASMTACSSDDTTTPPVSTAPDASVPAVDAPPAPPSEHVTASFGGMTYTLTSIDLAEVGTNGHAAVYVSNGQIGGTAIYLFFDPKTGTHTCNIGSGTSVIFRPAQTESYQAIENSGDCSIVVTQFGAVGTPIEGTFAATVKQLNNTTLIDGSGSFRVLRKK